jgi:predicted esterase
VIKENHITVERTARVFTLGEREAPIDCLVIACHGYGQLAKHFIRKFDVIVRPGTLVVAPEGLSRFYWGGLSGDVKASWMTKEDRLAEISDFTNYLTQVHEEYTTDLSNSAQIVLFGFSQGCATQLRWMIRARPDFSHLILWAGSIPEDIDYEPARSYLQDKPLHFVYGNEDPFITPDRVAQQKALAAKLPMGYQVNSFEGKHSLDRNALRKLFEQIRP